MESELSQAYYGVYCSSKEILKNNQRHLYCSMLDLLTSTCKTTGLVGSKIVSDEMIQFWLSDILALMFDTDRAIQTKAVEAFEQGLASMDVQKIHNSKEWPALKASLASVQAPKIHKLREERNPHWHRVWGYMIRILDKELLKGASTINAFLAIVELGFRSTDNTIRAESFMCWRLLIEIFAKYDELSSPKRLKLICIPLKSSQSKSAQAAEVKLRVWWYLLTRFGSKLGDNFEGVVEPFLHFCFGGVSGTKQMGSAAKQYEIVRELAIPCMAKLLSGERSEFLDRSLRDHKLEALESPSPLLENNILEKHWSTVANAAFESINLMVNESSDADVGEQRLFQQLLRHLLHMTFRKDIAPLTIHVCSSIQKMQNKSPRTVIIAINTLASEGMVAKKSSENMELYPKLLDAFTKLFISARSIVPPAILQRCVDKVFSLDAHDSGRSKWRALSIMMSNIFLLKDDEDFDAFETKLIIWRNVSHGLLRHLKENALDVRVRENALLMERWILWPVQVCVGFAGSKSASGFDTAFCSLWRQLINAGQNAPDRRSFISKLCGVLKDLPKVRHEESSFGELFDAYVMAVTKLECDKENVQHHEFFVLMQEILKQQLPKKPLEACLNTLRNALMGFKAAEANAVYDNIKSVLSAVVALNAKGSACSVENKFLDEWKRAVMDKLRSTLNKELFQQLKEVVKGNSDVFIVIPSVWSLNPDKLTERQKEKMAEKADIPALYNDMSQSQETSLKPWTPKKIVIAQKDKSEIVLEGQQLDEEVIEESEPTVVEKVSESIMTTPVSKKSSLRNQAKVPGTPREPQQHEEEKKLEQEVTRSTRNSKRSILATAPNTEEEPKEKLSATEESIIRRQTRRSGLRTKNDNKKAEETSGEKSKATSVVEKPHHHIENLSSPSKSAAGKTSTVSAAATEDIYDENDTPLIEKDKENILVEQQETQLPTMAETLPPTEITTDTPLNTARHAATQESEKSASAKAFSANTDSTGDSHKKDEASKKASNNIEILSNELIIDLNNKSNTNAITEILQTKEVSPKKTTTRFTPLSSPPDRKLTNNSSSPTLRPKPSAHLTGRGAQLINMIRNKKVDISAAAATTSTAGQTASVSTPSQQRNPAAELMELTGTDQTSTPVQHKDFLVFSKRLPSPTASPSASILKRKLRNDSIEDLSFDSPAFKRKRVSFHDPPVSVTKEYLRDAEETKTKPKRCLIMDKVSEAKHVLRRRSKLDSLIEIEKFNNPSDTNVAADRSAAHTQLNTASSGAAIMAPSCSTNTSNSANKSSDSVMDESVTSLKWNDSRNTTSDELPPPQPQSTTTATPTTDVTTIPTTANINEALTTSITPILHHQCNHPETQELNIDTAMTMVLEQCSLETILEKYFAHENTPELKSSRIVAKFLSNSMETHPKIKTNVLETLSENHSKDFLDHAVQENLSSVVCDRLNLNSVIDYICAKSKINSGCRNNLLQQLPDILKHSKNDAERFDFIENVLQQCQFTDEHILELINVLMQVRTGRKGGEHLTMVSESAVDSSSNL
ncbi:telomere-associated protein RIF1 [Stomoxys calcitrans]|uniref:Telomere-associated protein Rif1 N-terminal domain-containing protein n=1 Tax=Stomoxys calcitrans TaxID=35570 RepID=A0A1I8P600_STOCA|nr:telomere-associated protein RIF1 [Stomoxys calcitrans]